MMLFMCFMMHVKISVWRLGGQLQFSQFSSYLCTSSVYVRQYLTVFGTVAL